MHKFITSFGIKGNSRIAVLLLGCVFGSCSPRISATFLSRDKIVFEEPTKQQGLSSCRNFLNYSPDENHPDHAPMRYVRVNFHIVTNEKGDNNFTLKQGTDYARKVVAKSNDALAHNQKMSLPVGNNTPVLPIKYQFVLYKNPDDPDDSTGVYLHHDDQLAYFVKQGKNRNTFDQSLYEKYGVQKGHALNVFMLEHPPDSIHSPTYKASLDGVGFGEWIKSVASYQFLHDTIWQEDGSYSVNTNIMSINHEAGHSLGLAHTWNTNDGCDDTPTNPGCWDQNSGPCKETGVYSNNLMDYNNCMCALSPCQIAKIHYNFSRENSSQRKLLLPVWCDYKKDAAINIGMMDDIIWNSAKDLEGDIIIHNGGRLTIACEVSLPKGAKVIVEPKGTLVLDGGTLMNKCGDNWEGIEIWKSKKNEGKVIFRNHPQVFNANHSSRFKSR